MKEFFSKLSVSVNIIIFADTLYSKLKTSQSKQNTQFQAISTYSNENMIKVFFQALFEKNIPPMENGPFPII